MRVERLKAYGYLGHFALYLHLLRFVLQIGLRFNYFAMKSKFTLVSSPKQGKHLNIGIDGRRWLRALDLVDPV